MAVPVTAMIPSVESYEIASDKYRLLKLALELGVPIPKTVFVHDGNARGAVNRVTTYHVVVKPGRSLLKADQRWMRASVHIVGNEKELTELQSNNVES